MLPGALSDPLQDPVMSSQRHNLTAISLTCYNSNAAVQDHAMQLVITQLESTNLTPHNTTNNQTCDLRLKLLQCIGIARHHLTSQINFLSFISQKTLRQHKLPDPCHHLICSTTLRSEARTCQLLIAAEEKNQQSDSKMLPKLLSILPLPHYFLFFFLNCFFSYLSPFSPVPGFLPKLCSSSHSSLRSLPSIPHQ